MRVTAQQTETIKKLVHRHFGEDAAVWLFGSRTNDSKKGGDYDFFIETSMIQPDLIIEHKIALIAELQSSAPFEDEKINRIVKRRNSSFEMPIYAVAKEGGQAGNLSLLDLQGGLEASVAFADTPLLIQKNCVMSGIKYLLDTNFILGILKSSPAVLAEVSERKILAAECAYSAITPENTGAYSKSALSKEGGELTTNCSQLKMKSADGKNYLTDVANTAQLLRLIQSIANGNVPSYSA